MLSFHASKADNACNLECLEGKPPVHEFIGPVKIVLMDIPTKLYMKKMWLAAFIGMAKLTLGATVITVLYFALAMKTTLMPSLHIIFCTFGFQLCMPLSILMMSNLHGPSSQMKSKDRRKHHSIIQIIALLLATAGSVLGFINSNGDLQLEVTPHAICGMISCGFAIISILTGPTLFLRTERHDIIDSLKCAHIFFGIPTFVCSSVCFLLGLYYSKKFNDWIPLKEMLFIPIIFCVYYTIVISYNTLRRE